MSVHDRVRAAVAGVDDPELPGVSVADMGMVQRVDVTDDGHAVVVLVPTYTGCPALDVIRRDVAAAVRGVPGVRDVEVTFAATPVWTPLLINAAGRASLAAAGVAVAGNDGTACPRCGERTTRVSAFGPTRCREVHRCPGCGEVVEVIR